MNFDEMNRDELRKLAAELNIPGRSKMKVDQLRAAVKEKLRGALGNELESTDDGDDVPEEADDPTRPGAEEMAANYLLRLPKMTIGKAAATALSFTDAKLEGGDLDAWSTVPNRKDRRDWKFGGRRRHLREMARQKRAEEADQRQKDAAVAGSWGRSAKPKGTSND